MSAQPAPRGTVLLASSTLLSACDSTSDPASVTWQPAGEPAFAIDGCAAAEWDASVSGTTVGMLGFMFWAAELPSARRNCTPTTPPNECYGGMGVASPTFDIPVPMPPLRQH